MKTYKIRLYLNKSQRKLIDQMLYESKELYNYLLDCWKDYYYVTGKSPGKFKELEAFQKDFAELCPNLSYAIRQTIRNRLCDAFKRFFNKQNSFPKYKRFAKFRSLIYPSYKHTFNFGNNFVRVTGLGKIKAKIDRSILGIPKTCTIKKFPSGKYYAFIVADQVPSVLVPTGRKPEVGIDLGIEKFVTLSDGGYVRKPKFSWTPCNLKRLARAQRKLSRKRKGSRNYEKQRIKLAKIHEQIVNQRLDFHFKVAHWLVTNYDKICFEDISGSFMIQKQQRKSKNLAKQAIDLAFYQFKVILEHMSNKYSCQFIEVDPRNTSQLCSGCGSIVPKSLEVREHSCPNCGLVCDRDLNASINILGRGLGRGTAGMAESIKLAEIDIPGLSCK